MQQKKTIRQNATNIINDKITNVNPSLFNKLLDKIIHADVVNTKLEVEKYIRFQFKILQSVTRKSISYRTCRGWDRNEAYARAKEFKPNGNSVYSQKFWMNKINPITGVCYTLPTAKENHRI